jgi:hypothetical protein
MLIGHTAISGDHHNRRVANGAILAVRSGLTSTEVQPTVRGPYIPPVLWPRARIASLFRLGLSGTQSLLRLTHTPPTARDNQLTVIYDLSGFAAAARPLDI